MVAFDLALAYCVLLARHCDNPLASVGYVLMIVSSVSEGKTKRDSRRIAATLLALNFALFSPTQYPAQFILFASHALAAAGELDKARYFAATAYALQIPHEVRHDPAVAAAHAVLLVSNIRGIVEHQTKCDLQRRKQEIDAASKPK